MKTDKIISADDVGEWLGSKFLKFHLQKITVDNNETVVQKRECSRIRSPIQVPIRSYFFGCFYYTRSTVKIQFWYFPGDKTKNKF